MTQLHLIPNADFDASEPLTFEQREVLESALAKIVALGEEVGVTADQMIKLLDAGMTVKELLEYLATRAEELD
jgi:hypothetical protein